MNKHYTTATFCLTLFLAFAMIHQVLGQCTNPTVYLPDESNDVNGDLNNAYCVEVTFDPAITGLPDGVTMDLEHSWQGDISILISACGNILNVMQRPGDTGNCLGGSPFGNSADIGAPGMPVTLVFTDSGTTDPEDGIAITGGTYGITADDACGIGSPGITSFASLWASCPPGEITAEVCVSDHAGGDDGELSNVTFNFPTPVICGCTDPNAPNYDPSANVDDGSCLDPCPGFNVTTANPTVSVCAGTSASISGTANNALNPVYTWTATNGGVAYLDDATIPNPTVTIPPGVSGTIVYTLTVNENTCTETVDVELTIYPEPTPTINGDQLVCAGETTTLTVSGGAYNPISWDHGPGTASVDVGPGTYTVTVEDGNGCTATASYTVDEHPSFTPVITGPATFCNGESATLGLDQSYSAYSWSTSESSSTITVTQTGTYSVTVTDGNGCEGTASLTVTEDPPINISISGSNTFCENGSTVIAAPPGYDMYLWSTNETSESITVTETGTYSVTVTDGNGCTGEASLMVEESEGIQFTIAGQDYFCAGGGTTLSAPSGFSIYTWSTSASSESITVSSAGTYSVTVEDADGCMGDASIDVTEQSLPEPTISGEPVICDQETITLSVAPAFPVYNWSTTETSSSISVNIANTYSVTVEDSFGCQGEDAFVVSEAPPIDISITGDLQYCAEDGGTVLLAPSGYDQYVWSSSETTASITTSGAGTYTVTVTDTDGCQGTASTSVSEFPNPSPVISGLSAICAGEDTELSLNQSFSSYLWSDNSTTSTITVSQAGTYSVTVEDANMCVGETTFDLTINALPEPTIDAPDSFCAGASADLSVAESYASYQWNSGQVDQTITVFAPGTYTVVVTDGNDCSGSTSVTIDEDPLPDVDITGDLMICTPGEGQLDATSGYATYAWSSGGNSSSITISQAGTYVVTVTDDNSCMSTETVDVVEFPVPEPEIEGITILCPDSSGELFVDGNYSSIMWSNGFSSSSISVSTPGTYGVTVMDNNGCEGEASTVVEGVSAPTPMITGDHEICEGEGSFLDAGPGYASYQWSTNETTQFASFFETGTVSVTVTDANNCTGTDDFEVQAYPLPDPYLDGPAELCVGQEATLEAEPGYVLYEWNVPNFQSSLAISEPGTYSVTVYNEAGCEGEASIDVQEAVPPPLEILGETGICSGSSTILSIDGDFGDYNAINWSTGSVVLQTEVSQSGPVSVEVVFSNGCTAFASVDVSITDELSPTFNGETSFCVGGNTTIGLNESYDSYLWSNNMETPTIEVTTPGEYTVTVTDVAGCTGEGSIIISENELPSAAISGSLSYCPGTPTTLSGPAGLATYLWSTTEVSSSISVATPGPVSLTVTDANGCTNSSSVTIEETDFLSPVINGDLTICPDGSTILDAGEDFSSYQWTGGSGSSTLQVDAPGTYGLTVEDASGCEGFASVEVVEVPNPIPTISGDLEICLGATTDLLVPETFVSYEWNEGTQNSSLENISSGTYSVVVTDEEGCQGTATAVVIEDPEVSVEISGDASFCEGGASTLQVVGNYEQYNWSNNGTSSTIVVANGGDYEVTVVDDNECTGTGIITITEWALPTVVIDGSLSFCPGGATTLAATTGYPSYSWSTAATSSSIEATQADTYSVTVMDENGCENAASVSVEEQAELSPTITGELSFCAGSSTELSVGNGFAIYSWSDNTDQSDLVVTEAGTYSVSVEDAFGCAGTASVDVTELPLPTPEIGGELDFCTGDSTLLNGGSGYATYLWSIPGEEEQLVAVNAPGSYGLTVTDDDGCVGSTAVEVVENSLPEPSISGIAGFCPDASTLLTGAAGYTSYAWSTGTTSAVLEVDTADEYVLTVTDNNGCQGTISQSVEEYPVVQPEITGELAFCPGLSTELTASEGFVSYNWSDGSQSPNLAVENIGDISLSVIDANGCESSNTVTISEYEVNPPAIQGPEGFCTGEQASLDAGGSFSSYQWSTDAEEQIITVAEGGLYELTVTDNNNCSSTAAFAIEEYALPAPIIGGSQTFCVGNSTTINAGASYASYLWSTDATDQEIEVSEAGEYALTVTDENGCIGSTVVDIIEATELAPVISGDLTFCAGDTTLLDAGTGFSVYQWSNGSDASSILVTEPGIYSLEVQDDSGCSGSTSVEVVENALPSPEITGALAFCEGGSTTLGLSQTYATYEWSTGSPTPEIVLDEAGVVSILVADENACVGSSSAQIEVLPLPAFTITGSTAFCAGEEATLTVEPAYASYSWSTNAVTQAISLTNAGTVGVTVTDAAGCQSSASTQLEEIPLPLADAGAGLVLNCDVSELTLGGSGTTQGNEFLYEWSGPGIGPDQVNELSPLIDTAGIYSLTVINTDYGCMSVPASVEVVDETNEPVVVLEALDVIDCTTSSVLIDGSGSEVGTGIVYLWYDENMELIGGANEPTFNVQSPSIYFLEVMDTVTGCNNIASIEVEEDIAYPVAEAGPGQLLDCAISAVNLDGSASQEGETINYYWYTGEGDLLDGEQSNVALAGAPGWYFLLVVDNLNGCENIDSVFVDQDITLPDAEAGPGFELDCLTDAVTLSGAGSSVGPQYSYQWYLDGEAIEEGTSLDWTTGVVGSFILEVTDHSNACVSEDETEVLQGVEGPSDLVVIADSPTCYGDEDGSLTIQGVEGGTAPLMYSLDGLTFSSAQTYTDLSAGIYDIVVEDAIGCTYTAHVEIAEGNDLQLDLGEDQYIDLGERVDIVAQVNVDPSAIVEVNWNTQAALPCADCLVLADLELDVSTQFFLDITDENGCTDEDQLTIFVRKERPVYIPTAFSPDEDGVNDVFFINGGSSVVKIKSFLVFNRWGEPVFEVYNAVPNDLQWGWDGTYRGQPVNAAVYVFFAEIEFADGETAIYKGDVTIMR